MIFKKIIIISFNLNHIFITKRFSLIKYNIIGVYKRISYIYFSNMIYGYFFLPFFISFNPAELSLIS